MSSRNRQSNPVVPSALRYGRSTGRLEFSVRFDGKQLRERMAGASWSSDGGRALRLPERTRLGMQLTGGSEDSRVFALTLSLGGNRVLRGDAGAVVLCCASYYLHDGPRKGMELAIGRSKRPLARCIKQAGAATLHSYNNRQTTQIGPLHIGRHLTRLISICDTRNRACRCWDIEVVFRVFRIEYRWNTLLQWQPQPGGKEAEPGIGGRR
jgi:hypothetical protein